MTIKEARVNGLTLSYQEEGEGPVLVLLPGWNEDHRLYKRLIPHLTKDFRVLAFNWRNHGSKRDNPGDFAVADMAADVVALLDHLNVSPAAIVSFSHGGWIATDAAQRLGVTRAPKVVLLSFKLNEAGAALEKWSNEWQDSATWDAARREFFDYAKGQSDHPDILDHVSFEMPEYGEAYWFRTGREIAASYARWGTPMKRLAALEPSRPVMHVYTLPHDPAYDAQHRQFARENEWFRYFRLPGETHFPQLESPAAVARIIKDFVMQKDGENVMEKVRKLEQERCDAMLAKDIATLERLLDPELVYTHSSGVVDSKKSYIAGVRDRVWDYQHIERTEETMLVRTGVALVFNRTRMNLDVEGVNKKLDNNTLAVWIEADNGEWRFVALNSSPRAAHA
jgi:pimeloyl-ACP methyl ester carboxylesterase